MRLRDTSFAIGIGSTAPSSHADCAPWASGTSRRHQLGPGRNGVAERLIGSIRRECVDQIIVLGVAHLRQILRSYARYYNGIRTHSPVIEQGCAELSPGSADWCHQFARHP
jgi:hypothetical protein